VIQKIWTFPDSIEINIIVLLWRWWSTRNKFNAEGKMIKGVEVCLLVTYYVQVFENLKKKARQVQQPRTVKWQVPPDGLYKININTTSQGGWGFVARDCEGVFLEGGCGNLWNTASPLQGETYATLFALRRVADLGMSRIILETDAT
jgi:hypothetical protein